MISVKVTRDENAEYYGVSPGDIVSVELEEYVAAVTASEIGNSAIEACKAQAVAARTFAVNKGVLTGKVITDASSTDQAYRAKRYDSRIYPNAVQAAEDTAGEIIVYNGSAISAVYSACNGGRTVSSKTRWGSARPYLIEQDDPWDNSKTRTGHGVGMSQRGAKYAAGIGKTYREILAFYYPGTQIAIHMDSTQQAAEEGGHMIPVAAFIAQVLIPLMAGWGYIYKTHGRIWTAADQQKATRAQTKQYGSQWIGKMVTDCSGLIYWACMELGVKVVWHARYLYTDWCKNKGKLSGGKRTDGGTLLPGSLVFLQGKEDHIHHVGVYIGKNTCVEAKGTRWGVVTSEVSHWDHWGELKVVDYAGAEDLEDVEWKPEENVDMSTYAIVNNPQTWLNVRREPSSGAQLVTRVKKGTEVQVLDMSNPGWWKIQYNGKTGYASAEYLLLKGSETTMIEASEKPDEPENEVEEPEMDFAETDFGETVAQEPKQESLLDKIRNLFGGGKKEEPQPMNEVEKQDPVAVMEQLKLISGDLNTLAKLVEDAQHAPSLEALIEILSALDKVLPEIEANKNAMWQMITVG